MKVKKSLSIILIICIMWNLSSSAEGLSVKLRGKLALAGILTSVAFLTHTLVKRDKQAAENVQVQLGPAERIIQIERGFDKWEVHHYREQTIYFINNRFIRKKTSKVLFLNQTSLDYIKWGAVPYYLSNWNRSYSTFLNDTSVSVNPKWWSICPSLQRIVLQLETPYLQLLANELWLGQGYQRSYLKSQKSHLILKHLHESKYAIQFTLLIKIPFPIKCSSI